MFKQCHDNSLFTCNCIGIGSYISFLDPFPSSFTSERTCYPVNSPHMLPMPALGCKCSLTDGTFKWLLSCMLHLVCLPCNLALELQLAMTALEFWLFVSSQVNLQSTFTSFVNATVLALEYRILICRMSHPPVLPQCMNPVERQIAVGAFHIIADTLMHVFTMHTPTLVSGIPFTTSITMIRVKGVIIRYPLSTSVHFLVLFVIQMGHGFSTCFTTHFPLLSQMTLLSRTTLDTFCIVCKQFRYCTCMHPTTWAGYGLIYIMILFPHVVDKVITCLQPTWTLRTLEFVQCP